MKKNWVVFGAAILAYVIAMMHRALLGVAGTEAAEFFSSTPSLISTIVTVQLGAYAFGQIPAGLLIDRYGSRAVLTLGSIVMAAGQTVLATVDSLPVAYVARTFVGLGDACIYISILGLIPKWFSPRMAPLMSQLTGLFGVFGQLSALYGVLPGIRAWGWTTGVLVSAGVGLTTAAVVFAFVRNAPPDVEVERADKSLASVHRSVMTAIKHPATQLGFMIHFTAGFAMNAFTFMWGIPYLVMGQGVSPATAAGLFTALSLIGLFFGPIIGVLTARHPLRRSNLALAVIAFSLFGWCVILAVPQEAPIWLIVFLLVTLSAGGPGTVIGFDFNRTHVLQKGLGIANGIVTMGAFIGGTLMVLIIGLALNMLSDGASTYTFEQFRLAMALQIPMYLFGIAGILIARGRLRRRMAADGIVVPTWKEIFGRERRKRRNRRR